MDGETYGYGLGEGFDGERAEFDGGCGHGFFFSGLSILSHDPASGVVFFFFVII